ncbi:MAG: inosine/xanthosine triphosphatase [Methanomassiliicoccales archaeon]|nr:MAG: inosine/xanthosine triphosphatase [Methanomassiliicoccales archaeon]
MKVCLGGTFNILHKGHELLFERAFEDDNQVYIGLTSDELGRKNKGVEIDDYDARKKTLESFLRGKGWEGRFTIVTLDDELGPAVRDDYDAIVVSDETRSGAEAINYERKKDSLKPLEILSIKMAYAENGEVISATKIKKGYMDINGKMMRKVIVSVGSENQVKLDAAEHVFSKFFRRVQVKGLKVSGGVPEQPMEKEVIEGAIKRAKSALTEECDFGVGIEAGLIWNEVANKYFDVQYCAVIDKSKRITFGHGSGFYYPSVLIELVKQGRTIGQSIEESYGIKDVGRKMGAIGYLSKGIFDRTKLTEQGVLMAMIPRIRRELYEG